MYYTAFILRERGKPREQGTSVISLLMVFLAAFLTPIILRKLRLNIILVEVDEILMEYDRKKRNSYFPWGGFNSPHVEAEAK